MRAPVYRNLDRGSTLLGLAFPGEALLFLTACFALLAWAPPALAVVYSAALYAALRLSAQRKAPRYLQHWLASKIRQRMTGGRLSAVKRAPAPRFPIEPDPWSEWARVKAAEKKGWVH